MEVTWRRRGAGVRSEHDSWYKIAVRRVQGLGQWAGMTLGRGVQVGFGVTP